MPPPPTAQMGVRRTLKFCLYIPRVNSFGAPEANFDMLPQSRDIGGTPRAPGGQKNAQIFFLNFAIFSSGMNENMS